MPDTLHYESPPTVTPRGNAVRIVVLVGLLLFGVELWLNSDFWLYRPMWRVAIYVGALVACFVPPVQALFEAVDRLLSERSVWRTTALVIGIALASVAVLYATALSSNRQFTPVFHDEFSYLLQARMFASGHLWMPAHPLGDFFETFYVITDRAYASQYFPGTAIMLMPGVLLGWPTWLMPLILSGFACSAMFLLMRELFGGGVGLASVVLLIGVPSFRVESIFSLAQVPALMLGVIALWSVLSWDRVRVIRWLVATGFAIGWLGVTRPVEGVIVGVVCAAFVARRMRGEPKIAWRRAILAGVLPAVPFVMLQLVIDRGVTGHWLTTPFTYYAQRDMPGTALGFHGYDPAKRPVSTLPQKQDFFDLQVAKAVKEHTLAGAIMQWPRRRFANATTELFPDMLLVLVVPAAILALRDARRWLVLIVMPLWWIAYTLHVFTFWHYYVFYAASMFVLIFSGFDGIATCLNRRGARAMRAAQVLLPIVISVMAMPQFKKDVRDQAFNNGVELAIESRIATLPPSERAIILVRYDRRAIPEQEVVYNIDAAWPDEVRVIRAHDLGEGRNRELFRYYAERQPDRVVYRFERSDLSFARLGTVSELADAQVSSIDSPATSPTIESPTSRP